MQYNSNTPGGEQGEPKGTERQTDENDIGNDLGIGSEDGSQVSDFNPDEPVEEIDDVSKGNTGDDNRSADTGINPLPGEVDPEKKAINNDVNVENADEDDLNPYPDGLKPDDEDDEDHRKSTWMMSGQNRKI